MKKLIFASALALSASLFSEAFEIRVIDYPFYENHNSNAVDIRRVEAGENEVTVFADLYSRPDLCIKISSGTYIKGSESGCVLPILSCEGIELDKEVFPGQSGRIPVIMKFGGLSSEDNAFDFIEGDDPGAFKVKGVSLDMPLTDGNVTCRLEGVVADPAVGRIIVTEKGEDFRVLGHYVSIPVEDGRFAYDFQCDNEKYYTLFPYNEIIDGSWRTANFFGYDGVVHVEIPDCDDPIIVTGDMPDQKLAAELTAIHRSRRELLDSLGKDFTRENVLTPEGRELLEKMQTAEGDERKDLIAKLNSGDFYTEDYKVFKKLSESSQKESFRLELDFLAQHPSLFAITRVKEMMDPYVPEEIKGSYIALYDSVLVNYRPDYYYHEKIRNLRQAELLKPGNPYIDYDVTDSDGSKVKISKLLAGKVTVVDLWASWCGPCRNLSISYIPIYEKYKDKGFNVIGIAREQQSGIMESVVNQDGYPWKNYLELNDENKIWERNGVGNAGGTTFLIDKDGTILLVHPTAEQLEEMLEKLSAEGCL